MIFPIRLRMPGILPVRRGAKARPQGQDSGPQPPPKPRPHPEPDPDPASGDDPGDAPESTCQSPAQGAAVAAQGQPAPQRRPDQLENPLAAARLTPGLTSGPEPQAEQARMLWRRATRDLDALDGAGQPPRRDRSL